MRYERARRRVDGWLLAAVGVAGVVLGHSVAYYAVEPNAHGRSTLLRDTGHVYWNAAIAMAVVAAVSALVSHAVREFRSHRDAPDTTESLLRTGARLAVLQVSAYAVMEAAERASVHAPMSSMFVHQLFSIGVLIQIVVAVALVQVLRAIGHVAVAVARRLAPRVRHARPGLARRIATATPRVTSLWDRPGPSRAPPALA